MQQARALYPHLELTKSDVFGQLCKESFKIRCQRLLERVLQIPALPGESTPTPRMDNTPVSAQSPFSHHTFPLHVCFYTQATRVRTCEASTSARREPTQQTFKSGTCMEMSGAGSRKTCYFIRWCKTTSESASLSPTKCIFNGPSWV